MRKLIALRERFGRGRGSDAADGKDENCALREQFARARVLSFRGGGSGTFDETPHRGVADERAVNPARSWRGRQGPEDHSRSCPFPRTRQAAENHANMVALCVHDDNHPPRIRRPLRSRCGLPLSLPSFCRRDMCRSLCLRPRGGDSRHSDICRAVLVFFSRTRHTRICLPRALRRLRPVHCLDHRGAAVCGRAAHGSQRQAPCEARRAPARRQHPGDDHRIQSRSDLRQGSGLPLCPDQFRLARLLGAPPPLVIGKRVCDFRSEVEAHSSKASNARCWRAEG